MGDHLPLDTRLARKNRFGRTSPRESLPSSRLVEEVWCCGSSAGNIMMATILQRLAVEKLSQLELFVGEIAFETWQTCKSFLPNKNS